MEEYINVIVKEPGKAPVEITIRNELAPLNDLVDGYIETVQWDAKHVLIVNEEGKLRHMECNFLMRNMDMIVGTAVWAGVDGGDLVSVAPACWRKWPRRPDTVPTLRRISSSAATWRTSWRSF